MIKVTEQGKELLGTPWCQISLLSRFQCIQILSLPHSFPGSVLVMGVWQHMRVLMAIPCGPGGLRLGIHLLSEWCHLRDPPHCKTLPRSPSHLFALKESFLHLLTMGSPSTPGRHQKPSATGPPRHSRPGHSRGSSQQTDPK